VCGLALNWLGGDELHLIYIVQGQPWRWLWICTCVSLLVLPWLGIKLWARGRLGRATALVLAADYLLLGEAYLPPLLALTAAVFAASIYATRMEEGRQQLVVFGAWLVAVTAAVIAFGGFYINVSLHYFPQEPPRLPVWIMVLRQSTVYLLLVPVCVVLLIEAARRAHSLPRRWLLAALAGLACALVLPSAWMRWSSKEYGADDRAPFAAWRERIPADAQVLCPGSPLFAWLMLGHPSYLSLPQEESELFSRPASTEMTRREHNLRGFPNAIKARIAAPDPADPAAGTLRDICDKTGSEVSYIVSFDDLGAPPIEHIPASPAARFADLKLYQCPAHSAGS
jgi:hypothetical protein